MDGYSEVSLGHSVPFLAAVGLLSRSKESHLPEFLRDESTQLQSNIAALDTREAEFLESYFEQVDEGGKSWAPVTRDEGYRVRIKSGAREFPLPMRKAKLPEDADESDRNATLHSPFSPLSPMSKLYPDGLMDDSWIYKHQDLVPAVLMCFYALTTDANSATLEDNKLKADINQLRAAITAAGYKTRLAVIFLQTEGDGSSPLITDHLQERLESIRKGTGMDPKSMFYVAPQKTPDDLKSVADSILSNLYGTAIEYYRDLGRHARKKRGRGIAPQPTIRPTSGTSQTLSLPEWNMRYDFKTAVLSEFRRELEPAIRSFDQTYEQLMGQDIMDTIPSWSKRWNEARMLSDVITIRCLRLHLWMGQPSLAVRRWQAHRDRIGDFVDRRGQGTNNYGWQAWEARWALIMAQLIERVNIPALTSAASSIYLQPEKVVAAERLQPWEMLHHTGYWYRIAARHLGARRTLARMIPEEDREAPSMSTSQGKNKHLYDNYLCPPPHEEYPLSGAGTDHSRLIIDCLDAARQHFKARNQTRIATELALESARELASMQSWNEVFDILHPIWQSAAFRVEEWHTISEELCWQLRRAAVETNHADVVLSLDWELHDKKFSRRQHWTYDLNKSLDGLKIGEKPSLKLSDESATSLISAQFAFRNKESKAGETCMAQLCLVSNAGTGSAPITLANLKLEFEGSVNPIIIEHDAGVSPASTTGNTSLYTIPLKEEFDGNPNSDAPSKLSGKSLLTISPGQRLVLEMDVPIRVPGEAEARLVTMHYHSQAFELEFTHHFRETDTALGWFIAGSTKPRKIRMSSRALHIQPRPPKMEIQLTEPLRQYYANEPIVLTIVLKNDESEAANVKIEVDMFSRAPSAFHIAHHGEITSSVEDSDEEASIIGVMLGSISSTSSTEFSLMIDPATAPVLYEMQLRAVYHLESDSATPITQTLPLNLNLVNPFEANYNLVPRLHEDDWPSLFDHNGIEEGSPDTSRKPASGLAQKWCLLCHYASFAQTDLCVVDTELQVTSCVGGAQTSIKKTSHIPEGGVVVQPKSMQEAQFDLVAQKPTLDDRLPVQLELTFIIKWKHDDADKDQPLNTTTMIVGQYMVLGSEPRVLASVLHPPLNSLSTIQLDLTLENPSNHLLTFGLSMEPSDEFGFSGAKQTNIHLLPLSRRKVTYRLLPLVRGRYIRPGLHVRDKYFQKLLRIIPTENMKIDKDGLLIWIPGPNGETEDDVDQPDETTA